MGSKTDIEWTDATWNPIRGCSRVSEGCRNCYAEKVAYRFSGPGRPYEGLATKVNGHAAWTGKVEFAEKHLLDPLKWGPVRLECTSCGTDHMIVNCPERLSRPRRIFVNSMSDLFHENVPDEWIDRIFAVMALCPQHTFQILTKRPERMLKYLTDVEVQVRIARAGDPFEVEDVIRLEDYADRSHLRDGDGNLISVFSRWPLPNVWPGVSVENQKAADERIPLLLQTPAAVRFISAEPLLGPVNLTDLTVQHRHGGPEQWNALDKSEAADAGDEGLCSGVLDWVICGGESGPGARPMHPDWARSLRDQCHGSGVPFFFKQWGEWAEVDGGPPHRVFDVDKAHCPIDANNCVIALDGHVPGSQAQMHEDVRYRWMSRLGKKAAGALLDGREWREFPEGSKHNG